MGAGNRDGADGRLAGNSDGGVDSAVVGAIDDLGRAVDDGADMSRRDRAGGPFVLGLVLRLGAGVNPVPVSVVGVIAVIDDDVVRRVPEVGALLAGVFIRAKEFEIDVDPQREVDVEAEKGFGGDGHEGQGGGGGLDHFCGKCETRLWKASD